MASKQLRVLALFLAAFALGSILLVACARPGTTSATTGGNNASTSASPSPSSSNNGSSNSGSSGPCTSGTTVKTGTTTFEQTCIALKKGDTLKIVQDQTSFHILDYGLWNGNSAQPETPSGAPAMKSLKLSGPSVDVGPFTTAGTFHIYCIVHPGMNLTVQVK
ncbi:MAG TPA: hypothetical protein VFV38_02640 [Ktedonobacteraceae bacterium]|nr:hypothetical protein [Ktedonobacteraceae bacterium]